MQQLKVEHEKEITKRDRRESKGRVLAISHRIYRLQNIDVYYVESESSDNVYYFVKFKSNVLEWCSCKDNSTRHTNCKHLFAIEFAIKWDIIRIIDKLPAIANVKLDTFVPVTTATKIQSKSYSDDDYSF